MRKKLAILVFAGVMLFSGLNVFAAFECKHPSPIYIYTGPVYLENPTPCANPNHTNCTVYDASQNRVLVCHICTEELSKGEIVSIGKKHLTPDTTNMN